MIFPIGVSLRAAVQPELLMDIIRASGCDPPKNLITIKARSLVFIYPSWSFNYVKLIDLIAFVGEEVEDGEDDD